MAGAPLPRVNGRYWCEEFSVKALGIKEWKANVVLLSPFLDNLNQTQDSTRQFVPYIENTTGRLRSVTTIRNSWPGDHSGLAVSFKMEVLWFCSKSIDLNPGTLILTYGLMTIETRYIYIYREREKETKRIEWWATKREKERWLPIFSSDRRLVAR